VITTANVETPFESKKEKEIILDSSAVLFLAWAPPSHTRRSYLFAERLGIPLLRVYVLKPKSAPIRYIAQAFKTLRMLTHYRPKVIFVQSPPIFAVLIAYLYCRVSSAQFIVDAHTGAFTSVWRWALPMQRFLSKRATVTLVTNEYLRDLVIKWGGKAHIIRDIPSDFPLGHSAQLNQPFNVVMVSTYSSDEPLEAVIEAAATLPSVGFYITGNPARARKPLPANLPPNVHLTGYLSEEEYYGLLRSAQAIMSLTTADHTMQRGACEAVWLGKPIITSDWPLLRGFFHKGTIHVDNRAESIRQAVLRMQKEHIYLAVEIEELQLERRKLWQQWVIELQAMIQTARSRL
jgi:glycosyltransferase involved in cell wall biosynthesis